VKRAASGVVLRVEESCCQASRGWYVNHRWWRATAGEDHRKTRGRLLSDRPGWKERPEVSPRVRPEFEESERLVVRRRIKKGRQRRPRASCWLLWLPLEEQSRCRGGQGEGSGEVLWGR
jgi:hypothetical protein